MEPSAHPPPVVTQPGANFPELQRLQQQRQQLLQMQAQQAEAPPELPPATGQELQEQLTRLAQERRELKDYAERVTRELRRYQQARPTPPAGGPEDNMPLPPWATNMQMMSPLLFAYEERIAELEAVIERSVSLAEQAQLLAKENDQLRGELHERTEQLRNAQLLGPPGGSDKALSGGLDQQEEEVQELYRLSVEQNEALAQQNQLLKLQLERMQQTLAAGRQQAQEVHTRAYENSNLLADEKKKSETLSRQRAAVEHRLDDVTSELIAEVRKRETYEAEIESMRHELAMQKQTNDANQKSFQDRCALAADEEERLKADLARTVKSEKDYRKRLADAEQGQSETLEQLHVARKELESTKQQAEQLLQLTETLERRLVDIRDLHDDKASQLVAKEDQLAELQIEKDRWMTTEEAAKRQADRTEARMQADLTSLKQQQVFELDNLKSSHQRQVAELEERLGRSEQVASEAQTKVELYEKQRAWEASALERQSTTYNAERDRLRSDLDDAQQARLRLERQGAELQQQSAKLQRELEAMSQRTKEQVTLATTEQAALRSRCQIAEQRLTQVQDELQATVARATAAEAESTRARSEIQEEKLRASDELEAEKRRADAECRSLKRQLQGLENRSRQEEQRAAQLLRAQEALRVQWQTELGLERDELESKVERLSKENRAIREKVRGGLKALAAQRELSAS